LESYFDRVVFMTQLTPKVLAVIASNEPSDATRRSLESQTVPPAQIVVADRTFSDRYVGIRVAKAINSALDSLDLARFDWFLNVDGDVVLPPDWIERSAASGADVVGRGGYALLVRMSAFVAVGSRFPVVEAEDSLLMMKLQSLGFKAVPYVVKPKFTRELGRGVDQSLFMFFRKGISKWKLGYEPAHAVYTSLISAKRMRNLRYLLGVFGYFFAAAARAEHWDSNVAEFVFHKQIMSLRLDRIRSEADYVLFQGQ
jgi:hypothetical protein